MGLCGSKASSEHAGVHECSAAQQEARNGEQAGPSANAGTKAGQASAGHAVEQQRDASKLQTCQSPSSFNGPEAEDGAGALRHGVIMVASGAQQFMEDVRVETLGGGEASNSDMESCMACPRGHRAAKFLLQDTPPAPCSSTTGDMQAEDQLSCCASIPLSAEAMFDLTALEVGAQGLPHDVARYGAPRAPNEETRMQTIRALRHMGADSCAELDALLALICQVWGAPVSSVTLLDSEHVWMCNAHGCGAGHKPWAVAMCPWTLLTPHPETLAVGDLELDARFNGNMHHQGGTRSYLTAPLVASNGHRLGAICFVDPSPRTFTASDCCLMNNFAELAVREIEQHVRLADRLKEDDDEQQLSEVYRMRVRDVDEVADTCVMLVDTRAEGWRLLYASHTWREWTGVGREHCVGRTLAELLEYVHGDPSDGGIVWQGLVRNARESKPFVTPKVRVRDSVGAAPGIIQPLHHSFYLSFKAAGVDPLDADTVPVGVPAWVPMETSPSMAPLYFARLYTVPNPPPNSRANTGVHVSVRSSLLQAAALGAGLPSGGSSGGAITTMLGRVANRLEQMSPALAATHLFRGLKPSHVLGQGAFGTVWHALWHGTPVALKVVDSEVHDDEERSRCVAEIQLSASLTHVNVVRTLASASSLMDAAADGKPHGQGSSQPHLSGASACSASWLSGPAGREVCMVPCMGDMPLAGPCAPGAQAGPNGPVAAAAVLQWPSPARQATSPLAAAVAAAAPPPVTPTQTVRPQLAPAGPFAAAASPLDRTSVQAQTLDEQQEDGGEEMDVDEVVVTGMAPSQVMEAGASRVPPAPVPAYVAPMWHTLGGLECGGSGSHAVGGAGGGSGGAKGGGPGASPALWELSGVKRIASDTSQGGSNLGSLMSMLHADRSPSAAAPPPPPLPQHPQRVSFETSSAESCGGGLGRGSLVRRYSSGGLNGRWRRSMDAAATEPQTTIYPFSFRQWVLLEFCDRGSLGEAIDQGVFRVARHPAAPPDLTRLAATALDIAQGLVYLHGKGVVHGDLTAVNVLLQSTSSQDLLPGDARGFQAKLSDFGMAVKLGAAQESVVVGSYGAMTHMAPEVLVSRTVGYKADVYSLGVIMWQMMTGSRPWAGLSHLQVTVAVGHEHRMLQWPAWPPPPADPAAAASSMCHWGLQLSELGRACCDPDPDQRPTAQVVAARLKAICEQLLPAAARTGGLVGVGPLHFEPLAKPDATPAGAPAGEPAEQCAGSAGAEQGGMEGTSASTFSSSGITLRINLQASRANLAKAAAGEVSKT